MSEIAIKVYRCSDGTIAIRVPGKKRPQFISGDDKTPQELYEAIKWSLIEQGHFISESTLKEIVRSL